MIEKMKQAMRKKFERAEFQKNLDYDFNRIQQVAQKNARMPDQNPLNALNNASMLTDQQVDVIMDMERSLFNSTHQPLESTIQTPAIADSIKDDMSNYSEEECHELLDSLIKYNQTYQNLSYNNQYYDLMNNRTVKAGVLAQHKADLQRAKYGSQQKPNQQQKNSSLVNKESSIFAKQSLDHSILQSNCDTSQDDMTIDVGKGSVSIEGALKNSSEYIQYSQPVESLETEQDVLAPTLRRPNKFRRGVNIFQDQPQDRKKLKLRLDKNLLKDITRRREKNLKDLKTEDRLNKPTAIPFSYHTSRKFRMSQLSKPLQSNSIHESQNLKIQYDHGSGEMAKWGERKRYNQVFAGRYMFTLKENLAGKAQQNLAPISHEYSMDKSQSPRSPGNSLMATSKANRLFSPGITSRRITSDVIRSQENPTGGFKNFDFKNFAKIKNQLQIKQSLELKPPVDGENKFFRYRLNQGMDGMQNTARPFTQQIDVKQSFVNIRNHHGPFTPTTGTERQPYNQRMEPTERSVLSPPTQQSNRLSEYKDYVTFDHFSNIQKLHGNQNDNAIKMPLLAYESFELPSPHPLTIYGGYENKLYYIGPDSRENMGQSVEQLTNSSSSSVNKGSPRDQTLTFRGSPREQNLQKPNQQEQELASYRRPPISQKPKIESRRQSPQEISQNEDTASKDEENQMISDEYMTNHNPLLFIDNKRDRESMVTTQNVSQYRQSCTTSIITNKKEFKFGIQGFNIKQQERYDKSRVSKSGVGSRNQDTNTEHTGAAYALSQKESKQTELDMREDKKAKDFHAFMQPQVQTISLTQQNTISDHDSPMPSPPVEVMIENKTKKIVEEESPDQTPQKHGEKRLKLKKLQFGECNGESQQMGILQQIGEIDITSQGEKQSTLIHRRQTEKTLDNKMAGISNNDGTFSAMSNQRKTPLTPLSEKKRGETAGSVDTQSHQDAADQMMPMNIENGKEQQDEVKEIHGKSKQISIQMPEIIIDPTGQYHDKSKDQHDLKSKIDQYKIDSMRSGSSQMSQCSRKRCLEQLHKDQQLKQIIHQQFENLDSQNYEHRVYHQRFIPSAFKLKDQIALNNQIAYNNKSEQVSRDSKYRQTIQISEKNQTMQSGQTSPDYDPSERAASQIQKLRAAYNYSIHEKKPLTIQSNQQVINNQKKENIKSPKQGGPKLKSLELDRRKQTAKFERLWSKEVNTRGIEHKHLNAQQNRQSNTGFNDDLECLNDYSNINRKQSGKQSAWLNSRPLKNVQEFRSKVMTPPENKLRGKNPITIPSEPANAKELQESNVAENPDALLSGFSIDEEELLANSPLSTDARIWSSLFIKQLNDTIQVIKQNQIDFVDNPDTYRQKFLSKYDQKGKKKVTSTIMALRRTQRKRPSVLGTGRGAPSISPVKNIELEIPREDQLCRSIQPVPKLYNQQRVKQYRMFQKTKKLGQKFYQKYIKEDAKAQGSNPDLGHSQITSMYRMSESHQFNLI